MPISAAAAAVPAGTIINHSGTTAPAGYLACPVAATNISRTTYAALFLAIGTTWGVGNGSTTFGMPWFPADYVAGQANANVGTQTAGSIIAHSHPSTIFTYNSTVGAGSGLVNSSGALGALTPTQTMGSAGGASNLAAGVRLLMCVKY